MASIVLCIAILVFTSAGAASVLPAGAASVLPPGAASVLPPVAASVLPPVAASVLPAGAASVLPAGAASVLPAATALDPAAAGTAPGHSFLFRQYSIGIGEEVRAFFFSEITLIPSFGLSTVTLHIYRATVAAGYEELPSPGRYGVSYPCLTSSDVSASQSLRAIVVDSSFSAGSFEVGHLGLLVIRPILEMLQQNKSFVLRLFPYAVFEISSEYSAGYVIHQGDRNAFETIVSLVGKAIAISGDKGIRIIVAQMEWPEDKRDFVQMQASCLSYFQPDADAAIKKTRPVPDSPPYSFQIRMPNQLVQATPGVSSMTVAVGGATVVVGAGGLLAGNLIKVLYAKTKKKGMDQPVFAHWELVLTWDPSFCLEEGSKLSSTPCEIPIEPRFTVHGLWPFGTNSEFLRPIKDHPANVKFSMPSVEKLRSRLEKEWPDIHHGMKESFWEY